MLTNDNPRFFFINDKAGKAIGINLLIGQRPHGGVRQFRRRPADARMDPRPVRVRGWCMLVLHDDAEREYAYGPAAGLPDTNFGTFSQSLMDEAKKKGWTVISIKNDWKRVFAFE